MNRSQGQVRLRNVRASRVGDDTGETIKENKSKIEEMRKSNDILRDELDTERR